MPTLIVFSNLQLLGGVTYFLASANVNMCPVGSTSVTRDACVDATKVAAAYDGRSDVVTNSLTEGTVAAWGAVSLLLHPCVHLHINHATQSVRLGASFS